MALLRCLGFSMVYLAVFVGTSRAAIEVIPQSALQDTDFYYTETIGGGLGNIAVMTGGGSSPGIGVPTGRNDDGFRGPIDLGFTSPLSFFGSNYTEFWANNNGNVSFTGGISAFVPDGAVGANVPVISPYFGDVDTRNPASGVMYIRDDIAEQIIVTWDQVGRFSQQGDLLNSFQLVLRGPDYPVPVGEGSIGFFYKEMQWEVTGTSTTAAVGFGDGAGNGVVLEGSNQAGLVEVVNTSSLWFDPLLNPVVNGVVPEPSTIVLTAIGFLSLGMIGRRRRRR